MHKVKMRALLSLGLVCLLAVAMALYCWFYFSDGADWVAFPSNRHIYSGGALQNGTITDRSGTVLASTADGVRTYHESAAVRRATLHLVGDPAGRIGTGAQTKYAARLSGFSPVSGLFHAGSSDTGVRLSADASACVAAAQALGNLSGAVVVYDYLSGELLCSTSTPSFDPENIPDDLNSSAYDGVYVNRVFQAAYTPGSIMKVVTAAAAIEEMPDLFDRRFHCDGCLEVGSAEINCMHTHGSIAVGTALAKSCNVAFAELALELGGDTLHRYFERFGLLDSYNISGISTAAGRFDSSPDNTAALAWSGIGQSTDLVSPINMAIFMGAIGGDGTTTLPRLLMDEKAESVTLLSDSTAATLTKMLRYNVTSVYGVSRFPEEIREGLCAKSGTAEVDGAQPHAWFTGFIDDPDYPYAFAVIAEHGGYGSETAADIVAAVLDVLVKQA